MVEYLKLLTVCVTVVAGVFVYRLVSPLTYEHDINWINAPKITVKEGDEVCYVFDVEVKSMYYHNKMKEVSICRKRFGEE